VDWKQYLEELKKSIYVLKETNNQFREELKEEVLVFSSKVQRVLEEEATAAKKEAKESDEPEADAQYLGGSPDEENMYSLEEKERKRKEDVEILKHLKVLLEEENKHLKTRVKSHMRASRIINKSESLANALSTNALDELLFSIMRKDPAEYSGFIAFDVPYVLGTDGDGRNTEGVSYNLYERNEWRGLKVPGFRSRKRVSIEEIECTQNHHGTLIDPTDLILGCD
jgi:hypothetical protein